MLVHCAERTEGIVKKMGHTKPNLNLAHTRLNLTCVFKACALVTI